MVKRNVKCNNGKLKHAPPDHNDLRKRSSARVTRKPRVCTRQVGQKPSGKLQFGAEARTLPEIGAILTPMWPAADAPVGLLHLNQPARFRGTRADQVFS